jgi:hypothetical protein
MSSVIMHVRFLGRSTRNVLLHCWVYLSLYNRPGDYQFLVVPFLKKIQVTFTTSTPIKTCNQVLHQYCVPAYT